MRPLALLLPLFGLPVAAFAQAPEKPPAVPLIKLTVSAALAPTPVLRYELLPNFREQVPGNAALSYHRASLILTDRRPQDPKKAYEEQVRIDEMAEKPANEVKIDELQNYLQPYRNVLREVEAGARRDKCDWDLERRADADGIGLLIPEVQKMRELARLLSLRCRLHIVQGKYAEALHDVQVGFAMSRHIGEGPTLIQSLVGIAIYAIFANRLEQIIEMKDCPNLYWALTSLPRPMHDMRKPLEGEIRMIDGTLPFLKDVDKGPMTVEQVQRALDQWGMSFQSLTDGQDSDHFRSRLMMAAFVSMQYPQARKALQHSGKSEAEVNAMPAGQVVLLVSLLQFRSLRDEMFVWFNVPYVEAGPGLRRAEAKMRRMKEEETGDIFGRMLLMLLPAVQKVHFASVRTERRIAIQRVIEALRMHAAEHDGKLPGKLAELASVPLPVDPVTGKSFEYELISDAKALLTAPTPLGQMPNSSNTFKYELSLRK